MVCPEFGQECARHDHAPEREWRHLNAMQFLTLIKARVPRWRCPEHGVKTVRTPWAEPGSHFTLHFEAFAVQLIGACRSLTQVAGLLYRVGWGWSAATGGAGRDPWFGAAFAGGHPLDRARRKEFSARAKLHFGDERYCRSARAGGGA